jgi:uncharacterized repeat protein (TIGR03843 family)
MALELDQNTLIALDQGKIELRGEFTWGSNYTYLLEIQHQSEKYKVVYKPTQGEQPLWDFPPGSLAKREVAAYLTSQALNWCLVPPTVYRRQAPFGPGSVQLYIDHDPEYHYFNFKEEDRQRLDIVVLFDLVINNADRKGGHVLIDENNKLWLIDHGVCFHVEPKLRTVIWDFAGKRLPKKYRNDLQKFVEQLHLDHGNTPDWLVYMRECLSTQELSALGKRAEILANLTHFPEPDLDRRPYPWPPV